MKVTGVNRVVSTNNRYKQKGDKEENNKKQNKDKQKDKEYDTFTKQNVDNRFNVQNEFSSLLNKLKNGQ